MYGVPMLAFLGYSLAALTIAGGLLFVARAFED
jgi:small neutral amino acid transporter SnatA (MarC family)